MLVHVALITDKVNASVSPCLWTARVSTFAGLHTHIHTKGAVSPRYFVCLSRACVVLFLQVHGVSMVGLREACENVWGVCVR